MDDGKFTQVGAEHKGGAPSDHGINVPPSQQGRASVRCPCPQCQRGTRDDALHLTTNPDGSWVAHCHRCGWSAFSGRSRTEYMPPRRSVPPPAPAPDPAVQAAKLRAAWGHAQPWRGTLAETYLRARGCALPPPDADLRFEPQAWHWLERRAFPAMVALCTDARTGEPRTLHTTYLRPDGAGKAPVARPKLLMPGYPKKGAVVRLWPDEGVTGFLCVAEGIETALAAAHGCTPVWACVDAANLGALPVLPCIGELLIAADHDAAGLEAASQCAKRWRAAGRVVRVATPDEPGTDFADGVKR